VSAVEEIRLKLETRLGELDQEIASLRSALTALDAEAAAGVIGAVEVPAPAAPPAETVTARNGRRAPKRRSSGPSRTANGGGRTPARQRPSAELERELAETGGTSTVELARHTGADYAEVLARSRELERAAGR
jgi:hypothetical protein